MSKNPETPPVQPRTKSPADNLDAKLHQGYDPSLEASEKGNLFGSLMIPNDAAHVEAPELQAHAGGGFFKAVSRALAKLGLVAEPDSKVAQGGDDKINLAGDGASNGGGGVHLSGNRGGGIEGAYLDASHSGASDSLANAEVARAATGPAGGGGGGGGSDDPSDPDTASHLSAPRVSIGAEIGEEGQPLPVNITLWTDPEATSTTLRLTGVPAGATLNHGTLNSDGSWTLTVADLSGLMMTLPAHWAGDFRLTVTATSSNANETASASASADQDIEGVASTPSLGVTPATGDEGTAIPLDITASLGDTDGSESLTLTIRGVPAGATLSAGTRNPDGSWSLAPLDLAGLTLTPAPGFSGTINLSVTATSSENGTSNSVTETLPVDVTGVAGLPSLTVQNANGTEDAPIPLNISASIADTDGSETLVIVIGNVPAGAHLSAGTDNGDGTWTLTPAQLTGLTFTAPTHEAGSYALSITAISSENGTSETASLPLNITVAGAATPPDLTVAPSTGTENTPVTLDITAALNDTDGSETLSITIGNLPSGSLLSAGNQNSDGTWTLSVSDLSGLRLMPPPGFSGDIHLTVTATSSENGDTSSVSASLPVSIDGTAGMPSLTVQNAAGQEDTPVVLNIAASMDDMDGSEILSITIAGVPPGGMLSAGSDNGDGSWTLTPEMLAGLTFTAPLHSSGDFHLTVTATTSENNTSESASLPLLVSVEGVATPPDLTVMAASGDENTAIPLDITAALVDNDGTETLNVTISNLPAGATLSSGSQNPDGSWTLSQSQLVGLHLIPANGFSGTVSLAVSATSFEDTSSATVSTTLGVTITGTAQTPTVSAQPANGTEDSAIPLQITAGLQDNDGSETLAIIISDLPQGATLSAGTDNGDGRWILQPSDLTGLTLFPAAGYSGNITLTITAVAMENGDVATAVTSLPLNITGVADAPLLSTQAATGAEDTPIALNIVATLTDTDGSETLFLTITGVPADASLSAGTRNPDGSWTLSPANLPGLTLTSAADYSGSFTLTVTATTAENGTTATVTSQLPVTIAPVADIPVLTVQAASGNEDSPVPLDITAVQGDSDGSEALSITITGIPAGGHLSAGTDNGNGIWTLAANDLPGLTFTPPAHESGNYSFTVTVVSSEGNSSSTINATMGVTVAGVATLPDLSASPASGDEGTPIALSINAALVDTDGSETLSISITNVPTDAALSAGTRLSDGSWVLTHDDLANLTITPPAGFSGNIDLGVTATSFENGTTAAVSVTLPVSVDGTAGLPQMRTANASGNEDSNILLDIEATFADTDGSETMIIVISNVPQGARFSRGVDNGDGTWTMQQSDLANLNFIPPAHAAGVYALTVTAITSENNTHQSVSLPLAVTVLGIAHAPGLSVLPATGAEGSPVPLSINASLVDTDGSETLTMIIGNLPAGAILSAGHNNGDGTWTLTGAQLQGLNLIPTAHYSGTAALSILAVASENASTASSSTTLPVTVTGVATAPILSAQPATGVEDSSVALHVTALLADTDGSETMDIVIGNVPTGGQLSAGHDNGNGTWTLSPSDLNNLSFTPPPHGSGTYNLTITATSHEDGTVASSTVGLPVHISGVANAPFLNILGAAGVENNPVPLAISAALFDNDGSESLTIKISNMPAGATLSAGTHNPDGTWTLSSGDLTGLTLNPPHNWSGNLNLVVTATSSEDGTHADTTAVLPVLIAGIAHVPLLTVTAAAGLEDNAIPLVIGAALADIGLGILSVTIGNLPAGATLSAGTHNPDGTWTLQALDLIGLKLNPPHDFSGTIQLGVNATASLNGSSANNAAILNVSIGGVADAPIVTVNPVSGDEDTAIPLHINAVLSDNDGSETLTILITGVPAGATLSSGTHNPDGTWTVPASSVASLTLTPPAGYNGAINLLISATASENGTAATTSAVMAVTVNPVADAPTLHVQAATGAENAGIPLTITAALSAAGGSETLSVIIGNLPPGAQLSAGHDNGDGTWTLNPAQLAGLTLLPAHGWNGTVTLGVTAVTAEGSTTASTLAALPVTITAVADTPTLSVHAITGLEDAPVPLAISAALAGVDAGEVLSVTITGLPVGASLTVGTHNPDGSWTLTAAQAATAALVPPADYSGSFNLTVTATASLNGTTATATQALPVTITGVADAPTLTVKAATGAEGTAIALNIAAALTDTDGSESLSITVSGLPAGAGLSAGTHNPDGTWTLGLNDLTNLTVTPAANWSGASNITITAISSEGASTATTTATLPLTVTGVAGMPTLAVQAATGAEDTAIPLAIAASIADTDGSEILTITISNIPANSLLSAGTDNGDGSWTLTPAQLSGLTLTPPAGYNGTLLLSVTAQSTENGTSASTATPLTVIITGVADAPTLAVQAATGSEDAAVTLDISTALATGDHGSLEIVISNLPAGATLSAGRNNGDGTWTLSPADLSGLTLMPGANWNGTGALTITSTATENGTTASTTTTLPFAIAGVADAPLLSTQGAAGIEDASIALNISAALATGDTGTLGINISGLPAGATLSAGTQNPDGSWTLTIGDLAGLTLTPAANWNGSVNLNITATASENGADAVTTATLPLTIAGVADAPILTLQPAAGIEDTAIPLDISAALASGDNGMLSITVAGLPPGATLSAGHDNGNGTWTLTPAQLPGLTLSPAANWNGAGSLTITATATENGGSASTSATLGLNVTGVADAPVLSLQPAIGSEDSVTALHITAALAAGDNGDLSITIAGLPAGASLSAGHDNGDGSWTLTLAQLSGLTLTTPVGWNGGLNLTVTSTATENGQSASTTASLPVTIAGVVDAPLLTVQPAIGAEDANVSLNITATLAVGDNGTLSITISNLPPGATLSAGTNNGDGSWTLTPAELANLSLIPAANWNGALNLDVTATATENGQSISSSVTLPLTVAGVADAPTLNVQSALGTEDTGVALNITTALAAGDNGTLVVTISGVPTGATLSAGTHNPDGSWTLTSAQLSGLTLTPAANFNGAINLTVTSTATENGQSASISAALPVTIAGVTDAPSLAVQPAAGIEDASVSLSISTALAAGDNGILSISIAGVPAGATLSAGTHNPDGTWTLTPAQLSGLTLTPAANFNGPVNLTVTSTATENGQSASTVATLPLSIASVADAPVLNVQSAVGTEDANIGLNISTALAAGDHGTLSVTISGLPAGATLSAGAQNPDGSWTLTPAQLSGLTLNPAANYNGAITLTVTSTATENGQSVSTTASLPVTITGVADAPSLSVQAAAGAEDTAIALNIGSALAAGDNGTLSINISGLPAGAVLSAGTHNPNGSWTLTPAQLSGLTLTGGANWSGSSTLTVTATATENGQSASTTTSLPLTIAGVADAPTLNVQSATGLEDQAIPLNIAAALTDTDGSESLSITISGLPAGATLSAGTHNPNGSWTLSPLQLAGLTLVPAANWSGTGSLTITATSSENGTTSTATATLPVTVSGVADLPTIRVQAASGNEDTAIQLTIDAALTDTDGSETLSIGISGVPSGAVLSAGTKNADGTWSLTAAQLTNLSITPPANYNGAFILTVAAMTSESGTSASAAIQLPVSVLPVGDLPTLSVTATALGNEDTAIPLTITAGLTNPSETLTVMISGVPNGATLSHGLYAGNGQWSLSASDLSGLTITPPANYNGTMNLVVHAISTDSSGTPGTLALPVTVTVAPTPDAPSLNVVAAAGNEDTAISLNISAALRDTDGSETLTVSISGVPAGATLSAGTNAGGGVWNLTAAQLANLKITPPANSDADFNLTVTATSRESNNTTTSVSTTLPVTVYAVADTPTISASNATGVTGAQVSLTIGGAVTDSSETISYIIHGVPDGFALNRGVNNGDNSWSLTASDLSGLKIVSPETFQGQLNLYAQSVSHDNEGQTASSAATPFYVRFGNYSSGYLVDLGVNLNLGGIGVGVHVGLLPDIDLFPATGGLVQTNGIYTKEGASFAMTDASLLTGLSVLNGLTNLIAKIEFRGIPTGVTFTNGTNKGGGVWEFAVAQLGNIVMTVPAGSDNDFTITVVSKMLLGLLDIGLVSTPVHVAGIANMPTLTASAVNTTEDQAITLNIAGALTDTDGSESISYLVSGMPAGFTLNHGVQNGNGTWSLSTADLTGLTINPAANYSGTATFTVSAVATEREGDSTVKQQTVSVTVAAVADAPVISAVPVTSNEGQTINLNLGIGLVDTDGSETISAVTITGLPAGASLTHATDNHNGTWSVDVNYLNQIQLVPGADWSGDINLGVTAISRETSNGSTASTSGTIPIHINAVADAPYLSAANVTGNEDQAIQLNLGGGLTDTDGSEHFSAVVSGLPLGAHLSAGLNNGDGSWTLTQAQLNNLSLLPPGHFSGDMSLSLTVYSFEDNGSTASATQNFNVHVNAASGAGSWLDHTVDTQGTATAPAAAAAQDAVNAAAVTAHDPGSDYQHAFQNHQS